RGICGSACRCPSIHPAFNPRLDAAGIQGGGGVVHRGLIDLDFLAAAHVEAECAGTDAGAVDPPEAAAAVDGDDGITTARIEEGPACGLLNGRAGRVRGFGEDGGWG